MYVHHCKISAFLLSKETLIFIVYFKFTYLVSVMILSHSGSARWPLLIGLRQDSHGRPDQLLWNDNSPYTYNNFTESHERLYVQWFYCRFKFFTSFVFPDAMNRNINLFRHNFSTLSSIFLRTPPMCFREDVFL